MNLTDVGCDGSYMELIYDQIQCLSFAFFFLCCPTELLNNNRFTDFTGLRARSCVYSYALFLNVKKLDRV